MPVYASCHVPSCLRSTPNLSKQRHAHDEQISPLGQIGVGIAAAEADLVAGNLAGLGRPAQDARREGVVLGQGALVLRPPLQPPRGLLVQLLMGADVALLPCGDQSALNNLHWAQRVADCIRQQGPAPTNLSNTES